MMELTRRCNGCAQTGSTTLSARSCERNHSTGAPVANGNPVVSPVMAFRIPPRTKTLRRSLCSWPCHCCRPPLATRSRTAMRLDGHLHIWSGDEDAFPYNRERGGSPNFNIPPVRARPSRWSRRLTVTSAVLMCCCWRWQGPAGLCGTAEELLRGQADVQVSGAMIVQPLHHGYDHSVHPPPPQPPHPVEQHLYTLRIFHPAARRLCYGRDETVPGGVQGLVRDRPPSWPREGRGGAGAAARELTAPSFRRLFTPAWLDEQRIVCRATGGPAFA